MKIFMLLFGVLLLFIFLGSCGAPEHKSPRYVGLAHDITRKTAKKLKKEKGLMPVGTGGQMMHDIQVMTMSFFLYREASLEEVRELMVYAVEEYLSAINSNEEVRPYLHEYPFGPKNVEIRLWLCDTDQSDLPEGKIHYVLVSEGVISYYLPDGNSRKTFLDVATIY